MGLLDSNKILPFSKKIEITDKVCDADSYITNGLIDVKEYSAAVFYIRGTFAEGVNMTVRSLIANKNNTIYAVWGNFVSVNNLDEMSIINENGNYAADLSKVSRWGLRTLTAGTFTAEIYLVSKSTDITAEFLLEKIRLLEQSINTATNTTAENSSTIDSTIKSIDGLYSNTQGSFSLDGTIGTKLTKNISKEYSVMALEVALSDNNPFRLDITIRKNGTVVEENIIARNANGEIYAPIRKNGLYYIDIKGVSSVYIRQNQSGTSASGDISYRLMKDAPIDYKPIQEIYSIDETFVGGETSKDIYFSNQVFNIKYFKFIKAEFSYTGTNTPSAAISLAPYYGSSVRGALKEVLVMSEKMDATDWIQNVGTMLVFRINFKGEFTPAANDTLSVKLFGMR